MNSFTAEIKANEQCTGWCNLIGMTTFKEHSAWANVPRDCWGFSELLYLKHLEIMKIKAVEWSTSNICHHSRLQMMQDIFLLNKWGVTQLIQKTFSVLAIFKTKIQGFQLTCMCSREYTLRTFSYTKQWIYRVSSLCWHKTKVTQHMYTFYTEKHFFFLGLHGTAVHKLSYHFVH